MSIIPRGFYLDDIFDDDFDKMIPSNRINSMKCDVYEKDGNYNIDMDIPGFNKNDIKIECEDGLLTISAEKKIDNKEEDKDKRFIRRERVFGKVSRSFTFNDIDESKINAEFKDGTLKVIIPKVEKSNSKKYIEIK
jgi:HSP20 family molecular chaperone IbpA